MKDRLYIASIADDAANLAAQYGIGLELDHYCTAVNMEEPLFTDTDVQVRKEIAKAKSPHLIFHAPFNELYPAAIDPEIREIAFMRYERAYCLAQTYDICKMVVHSGYVPRIYYKEWYHEKAVEFWKTFMKNKPENFMICIENVLEDEPHMAAKLAEELGQENIRLCLDIGHANCIGSVSVEEWIRVCGPFISHMHIHNNNGAHDFHSALDEGTIHMIQVFENIDKYCDRDTTITIESLDGRKSIEWLYKEGYLK